jgi:hypothetical protein
MKQSNFIIELQYQYLNYITGIPVLYKILKKNHNTGKKIYTSDRQVQEIHVQYRDVLILYYYDFRKFRLPVSLSFLFSCTTIYQSEQGKNELLNCMFSTTHLNHTSTYNLTQTNF